MNNTPRYDEVLESALLIWTPDVQRAKVIEACSRLICTLAIDQQTRGARSGKEIYSEIAEVEILMRQLSIAAGIEQVDAYITDRMQRLDAALEDGNV
jgi:hypothetical protein